MLCMHIEQAVHQMIFENLKETAKAGGLNSLETVGFKKIHFMTKVKHYLFTCGFCFFGCTAQGYQVMLRSILCRK